MSLDKLFVAKMIYGVAVLAGGSGCVSSGAYPAALESSGSPHAELRQLMTAESARTRALEHELAQRRAEIAGLRASVDELTARSEALTASERWVARALNDARTHEDALEKVEAATAARAHLVHDVAVRLEKMVGAGDLKVSLRDGRMILRVPSDVLFASGAASIAPRSSAAIRGIAEVMRSIPDHDFLVAGHTDDVPVDAGQFPSNWELSAARAACVVRRLVALGVPPKSLAVAGYGEFDPVEPNGTAAGRARNRRIEITVQPRVTELVSVPEAP